MRCCRTFPESSVFVAAWLPNVIRGPHETHCSAHEERMILVGEALILRPGCYGEYKRRHDELWPELAAVMRENGINMVIYRFGDTLFVYGTAPSREAWMEVEKHSVTPRWNAFMAEVLETDEKGDPVVHKLDRAFTFGV